MARSLRFCHMYGITKKMDTQMPPTTAAPPRPSPNTYRMAKLNASHDILYHVRNVWIRSGFSLASMSLGRLAPVDLSKASIWSRTTKLTFCMPRRSPGNALLATAVPSNGAGGSTSSRGRSLANSAWICSTCSGDNT
ncbi:hypothetical protein H257_05000 [Aphanomyces astaci]|uniref:Uncharacterized protein n=1 Tax=Aphanomyces astaci TaxID=112090 RepID=W4GTV7_APHAT|nr:hypothetical protein H257_05000 [Aphanomyces astaci]ETV82338.1 hypothetical protein H257_05000 [Aphanomyces astaci]|eukprot:XP_009828007.1 hypothetical protein H257_05000 [Aphanomyces astaci]